MCFSPHSSLTGPASGFVEFGTGNSHCQNPHGLAMWRGKFCPEDRKDVCTGDISLEGQGFPVPVTALTQAFDWLVCWLAFLVLFSLRCFVFLVFLFNFHIDKKRWGQRERSLFVGLNSSWVNNSGDQHKDQTNFTMRVFFEANLKGFPLPAR